MPQNADRYEVWYPEMIVVRFFNEAYINIAYFGWTSETITYVQLAQTGEKRSDSIENFIVPIWDISAQFPQ